MEGAELAKKIQMMLASRHDGLEVAAGGDSGAGDKEQQLLQRVSDPPALAIIVDLSKVLQQRH